MKRILTIMCFLILCAAGITLAALTYHLPPTTEVVLLRDVTESFIAQPDASEVIRLYNLSGDNRWNGAEFSFSAVTDVSYNPSAVIKIDAANEWLSNELERAKDTKQFQEELTEILANAKKDTIGRWNSSIYFPIAERVIHLSQSKAKKRILLVYSDLMENTNGVSFYNSKEFSLMKSDPDLLRNSLEKIQPLPSLNGIEVYLIYQPRSAKEDSEYRVVSDFYRNMLQSKGARVHVSANLLN